MIIAFPVGYLLAKNWLNDFAYRIELSWWIFLGAGVLVLLIAWLHRESIHGQGCQDKPYPLHKMMSR